MRHSPTKKRRSMPLRSPSNQGSYHILLNRQQPLFSQNRLNHWVEWSLGVKKTDLSRKVSVQVSLRRLRRLTWVDTFSPMH